MPYRTALGYTYDSGEFARNLDDAVRIGGRADRENRRAAATARGVLAGLGLASYIHVTPVVGDEMASLRIDGAGAVTLRSGSQSNGQGHATTFAQVLADGLAIPVASVVVVQGDTERVAGGTGSGGSRTLLHSATAMMDAAAKIIAKGTLLAGAMLEAAPADIAYADGRFAIRGTDRCVGLFDVAASAERAGEPLAAVGSASAEHSFPNGCHLCEVEVDPETGVTEIVRYTVVDDLGAVVNPLLAAGQVHGGTVQGIGQGLFEATRFDPDSGQLLSGSFMDYCLPRAGDVPPLDVSTNGVACRSNPLGIKGAGEVGAIGAPAAVVNAVLDALSPLGVDAIDMPLTPERVWRAIRVAMRA
jgi:carbon-monoxide dehydrogenase large subunit